MDVRETFLPFAVKSRLASQVRVDCDGCLRSTQPQLVASRSVLTRPSRMNNHKAVRGADFFCKVAFPQPSKAMLHQAIALNTVQSKSGASLSVHLPNQPIR